MIAGVALLSGATGFLLSRYFHPGASTDDFIRLFLAAKWAQKPELVQFGNWPPFYSAVYGCVLKLGFDVLISAHVLTAFFSGATVYLVARLAYEVTQLFWIALLAAVLTATSSLHITLSYSFLAEPLYGVLFLCFVLFTIQWLRRKDNRSLLLATLFCVMMTQTRTDGTPLAGFFALLILYRQRNFMAWTCATLSVLFPILWVFILTREFASLPELLTLYELDSRTFYQGNPYWNFIPALSLLKLFTLPVIAMIWSLINYKKHDQTYRLFIAFAFLALAAQLFLLWNRVSTVMPERTIYVQGVLANIFLASRVIYLWEKRKPFLRIMVIAVCLIYVTGQIRLASAFNPIYDRKIASLSTSLRPVFDILKKNALFIASDLDDARLGVLTAFSKSPQIFTRIKVNPETNLLTIRDNVTPILYIVGSESIKDTILKNWRGSKAVTHGSISFITHQDDLLTSLQNHLSF